MSPTDFITPIVIARAIDNTQDDTPWAAKTIIIAVVLTAALIALYGIHSVCYETL
ncbi:hypothetical protein [Agrobacterium tumefaciens]|jgi:hypothetical protein|uniref:hypothetical protein n=1 Tax=Agrobacterium tumefaciens TaxID=358 RepID=UPI001CBCA7A7|nr:hypothetical protein [Agrobacterium tumefaciens]